MKRYRVGSYGVSKKSQAKSLSVRTYVRTENEKKSIVCFSSPVKEIISVKESDLIEVRRFILFFYKGHDKGRNSAKDENSPNKSRAG